MKKSLIIMVCLVAHCFAQQSENIICRATQLSTPQDCYERIRVLRQEYGKLINPQLFQGRFLTGEEIDNEIGKDRLNSIENEMHFVIDTLLNFENLSENEYQKVVNLKIDLLKSTDHTTECEQILTFIQTLNLQRTNQSFRHSLWVDYLNTQYQRAKFEPTKYNKAKKLIDDEIAKYDKELPEDVAMLAINILWCERYKEDFKNTANHYQSIISNMSNEKVKKRLLKEIETVKENCTLQTWKPD